MSIKEYIYKRKYIKNIYNYNSNNLISYPKNTLYSIEKLNL